MRTGKKIELKMKLSFSVLSVSINLSTRWQTLKKEGKFVEHELVGVCGYGRGRVRRKQAKSPEKRAFQGIFKCLL